MHMLSISQFPIHCLSPIVYCVDQPWNLGRMRYNHRLKKPIFDKEFGLVKVFVLENDDWKTMIWSMLEDVRTTFFLTLSTLMGFILVTPVVTASMVIV